LRTTAGPFTEERCHDMLVNDANTGVLQLLKSPSDPGQGLRADGSAWRCQIG